MATVNLQRLPQDVSAAHDRCHGDKPWQFRDDMIVWGTKIVLRYVKPGVVYKLNSISSLSRFSDWSANSGSYFLHSTGTFAVSTGSPLRQ